jgi:hypothetical protein
VKAVKAELLKERLMLLLQKTTGAERLRWRSGYWVGDKAGERRVLDDMAAGRLHWSSANNMARRGLEALGDGDIEMAELCAWTATDHYLAALEVRVRPSDMKVLNRPSQLRGRPRKK